MTNDDDRMDADPPFGLPVLAEVPELAAVLEDLVHVDRLLARALEGIIRLQDHSVAESTTGLPLERWLAGVARRTGSDRRMLATAATACRRLPSLRGAFAQGRVSWAQVRAVALKVERLPRLLDDRIDGAVGDAIEGGVGVDPDDLCKVITWTLDAIEAEHQPATREESAEEDWLALQPRLDGTGGQVHGEFGAEGFALLDGALNTGTAPTGRTRAGMGSDPDPVAARATARQLARHRARRLKELCRTADDTTGPSATGATPTTILRAELDTLLARAPGALLTRLTGGRLHVDAATARRFMDTYGTRLRVVLVDHGRVVGVGRTSRQPPGWLRDAVLALHDVCSEPGCSVAARCGDLDHARPWDDDGPTDIDELAPMCATANHDKEQAGWRVTQAADGVRVWTHERSGLTTRTLPATWRPPPRDPPPEGGLSSGRVPSPEGGASPDRGPPPEDGASPDRGPPPEGGASPDRGSRPERRAGPDHRSPP